MPNFTESAFQRLTGQKPFPQPPLIRLRYPIVLMHGFGILAGLLRKGHLHDEAMSLRRRGVLAFAPNVAPYHTVTERAKMWEHRLAHVLRETQASKLNLVAHSMGGLDARYLISCKGLHERVATLTTIATPHHGTYAATVLMQQPNLLRRLVTEVADWMGARVLDDATADFQQAVADLTPEHVNGVFNPAVPDHPAVRYWSYAGRAGKGTDAPISPLFRLLNHLIYAREGVNDGYVSVESARWGTFLGTLDLDHGREIGLPPLPGTRAKSSAFYRSIARMLADEGF